MAKLPDQSSFGARPGFNVTGPRLGAYDAAASQTGEAVVQLGRTLGQVGRDIYQMADQKKREDDKIRAEDAFNELRQKQLDLTIGEAGFTNKKGADAVNDQIFKDYQTQFEQAISTIEEKLPNIEQKQLFRSRADIASLQFKEDQIRHFTAERNNYAKEVFGNTLILEQNEAAQRWNDPSGINLSMERIKGVINAEAQRDKWSDEKRQAAIKAEEAKVHAGVIEQALAAESVDYAKSWYTQNKKAFDAGAKAKIERLIAAGERKTLAQTVSDKFLEQNMTEAEAIKEARKKYSGATEEEVVSQIKMRYGELEQAREAEQRNAGDEAWQTFEDTGDINQIPVTVMDRMDGKEALALKKYAQDKAAGRATQTDMATYQELIFEARENPNAFVKRNILGYADKLSEADRRNFIEWQGKIRSGEKDTKLATAMTRDQIVKSAISGMGLDPKEVSATSDYGDRVRAAYKRFDEEILDYQRSTGKEPDNAKMQEIADRLTVKVLRQRPFWFDTEIPVGLLEIEGIPSGKLDDYAIAIRNAGQPVTEQNIKLLHQYLTQGKTVSAPPAQKPQKTEARTQTFLETPVPVSD